MSSCCQTSSDMPAPMPARPQGGHKGTFGTVIVVGGSPTMIGAPGLAARAAFRAGAGLVKIASDAQALPFCLLAEPSATGILLPDSAEKAIKALDEADPDNRAILAIGPGWGVPKEEDPRSNSLWRMVFGARGVVLDADGLNALAALIAHKESNARLLTRAALAESAKEHIAPLVLTPHPGEYRRLASALNIKLDPTDPAQRPEAAAALAKACGAIVVLKGNHTIVSDGKRVFENQTGGPALATAGTGDVLTGVIAGLMAQGMDAYAAACLGVCAHGHAGDKWSSVNGERGLLARELADELPAVLRKCATKCNCVSGSCGK